MIRIIIPTPIKIIPITFREFIVSFKKIKDIRIVER